MKSKALSAVLSVTTTVWLSGAAVLLPVAANAQTTADLQAQISALLAQIAALQAQLNATGGGSSAVSCNFTRSLTVGSTGDDVKCLQKYLNGAGYQVSATGAGSPGNETSYFGPRTTAAVAKWQAANGVAPAVGYFGPISRAKYNALVSVVTPPVVPPVVVPGTGLAIALASDNPMGATVPKGASAVNVLKFTVSGNGTLNEVTFKRNGVGATTDFTSAGIYLYEGATRLTSGRSLNSTSHTVSFVNLGLQVAGTRTLWLAADVATGATSGNKNYFTLATSAGTPSVSGSLMGNTFEIGGQTAGVATTTKVGSLSSTTVGAKNVQVSEFRLDISGVEDVEVSSIAMTEGGTITDSYLSNFVLKQNDVTLATAAGIAGKDLVTFNFATPLVIEKGQQKTFKVYADIAGGTRSGDQIKLYFDSASDVKAKGKIYGFNVQVDITGMDTSAEAHTVALTGGDVTITFNGPISGDIARRGQDVEIFNFTVATKNAIEIRNWRFDASTTNLIAGEGFTDVKVWDTSNNSVITSPYDISGNVTSTNTVLTDVFTMAAGASKTFKVTVDVDADNDNADTITMKLAAFGASDIKNLDNNQFVATTDIVPSSNIAGNQQSVQVPSLDVQLGAAPSSQTLVQGSSNKDLVAFSFKATADNIKISTMKVTASATTGTLTSGEVTNIALYDGATIVSDVKSLNSSDLTATFTGLNIVVTKGETKVLTVRGNISTDATDTDVFVVKIADTSTDLTVTDSDSNSASVTGVNPNQVQTVLVTITSVGSVTVVKAADDAESEAGVVVANGERVLAKFRFTATNEAMIVNKLHILVNSSTSNTATTTTTSDDAPTLNLYDGTTLLKAVSVNNGGASSSIAEVANLGWTIPKDASKTLTVKAVIPAVGQSGAGADFGTNLYAHIMAAGFEAQGATAKDTTITAAAGNQKLVYKTKPTLSVSSAGLDALGVGSKKIIKFTVAADGAGQVAWKRVQFKVATTGATLTAGTGSNIIIRRTTGSQTNLSLASAWTDKQEDDATSTEAIGRDTTGYVSIVLTTPEEIAGGSSQEYVVLIDVANMPASTETAAVSTNLHRVETAQSTGTYGAIGLTSAVHDASDSFIWSDYSVSTHDETTADWANGHLVTVLPSDTVTITK